MMKEKELVPLLNKDVSTMGGLFGSVSAMDALEAEYGEYMPLIVELITFFGKRYDKGLSKFFRTSVDEFASDTGIEKSALNRKIELPSDRKEYPVFKGREFSTFFDYTMYLMATKSWVLSETIKIIEEVEISSKKGAPNGAKIYDLKFSQAFLDAMDYNLWTINTKAKKGLGQFRRSKNIRMLFHHLSYHIYGALCQKGDFITFSIDEMAGFARLNKEQEPKHIKYSIKRMLERICALKDPEISYQFIRKEKYNDDYYVKVSLNNQFKTI